MSNNNQELNDDESEALRRELEARASKSPADQAAAEHDESDEDLEAYLQSLEADDEPVSAARPVQSAAPVSDPFADQFAELEAAYGHEIVLPEPEPIKPSRQELKAAKKQAAEDAKRQAAEKKAADKQAAADAVQAEKDAKQAEKDALLAAKQAKKAEKAAQQRPIALRILIWTLLGLPVFALWWLVGSFLAQWISAAWLIALVTTAFAFGLPGLLVHFVKRGRYIYWLSGASLLLTVLLVAPMPPTASKNLAEYGHWPASTIAEVSGLAADHALVSLNNSVAHFTAGLIDPAGREQPGHRLGTETPLSGEPAEAVPSPPVPQQLDTNAPAAEKPDQAQPENPTQRPEAVVPAPQRPERAQPEIPTRNPAE